MLPIRWKHTSARVENDLRPHHWLLQQMFMEFQGYASLSLGSESTSVNSQRVYILLFRRESDSK